VLVRAVAVLAFVGVALHAVLLMTVQVRAHPPSPSSWSYH
jgi:hypothetical protein